MLPIFDRIWKRIVKFARKRERENPPPGLYSLLQRRSLSGFKVRQVWSITAIPNARGNIPLNASKTALLAKNFVGERPLKPSDLRSETDSYHPYILSTDRDLLIDLLKMTGGKYGNKILWEELVRPAIVLVSRWEGWAVPAGGLDSREIFPHPGVMLGGLVPSWSWLLHSEDFDPLVEADPLCFMVALGREPFRFPPPPITW